MQVKCIGETLSESATKIRQKATELGEELGEELDEEMFVYTLEKLSEQQKLKKLLEEQQKLEQPSEKQKSLAADATTSTAVYLQKAQEEFEKQCYLLLKQLPHEMQEQIKFPMEQEDASTTTLCVKQQHAATPQDGMTSSQIIKRLKFIENKYFKLLITAINPENILTPEPGPNPKIFYYKGIQFPMDDKSFITNVANSYANNIFSLYDLPYFAKTPVHTRTEKTDTTFDSSLSTTQKKCKTAYNILLKNVTSLHLQLLQEHMVSQILKWINSCSLHENPLTIECLHLSCEQSDAVVQEFAIEPFYQCIKEDYSHLCDFFLECSHNNDSHSEITIIKSSFPKKFTLSEITQWINAFECQNSSSAKHVFCVQVILPILGMIEFFTNYMKTGKDGAAQTYLNSITKKLITFVQDNMLISQLQNPMSYRPNVTQCNPQCFSLENYLYFY